MEAALIPCFRTLHVCCHLANLTPYTGLHPGIETARATRTAVIGKTAPPVQLRLMVPSQVPTFSPLSASSSNQ